MVVTLKKQLVSVGISNSFEVTSFCEKRREPRPRTREKRREKEQKWKMDQTFFHDTRNDAAAASPAVLPSLKNVLPSQTGFEFCEETLLKSGKYSQSN